MEKLKIIYIGCVESSKRFLEGILELDFVEISGLVTKQASKVNSDFVDLGKHFKGLSPIFYYDNNVVKMEKWVKDIDADIICCFGWSHILPQGILTSKERGVVGFHPAMLPKNRGRHPVIWALALGLKETASTFFQMDGGADTGDIISQIKVSIDDSDDARSLYDKILAVGRKQIKSIIHDVYKNCLISEPQDHSAASSWRKRTYQDGLIDWRMSSKVIFNLVRALSKPYVGASFIYREKEIKVWKVRVINSKDSYMNIESGKIVAVKHDAIDVKTGDGILRLCDYSKDFSPEVGEYL